VRERDRAGRAIAGLLAVFAAFEREILGERTRAGLAHARQNGKRLGRPATAVAHAAEIRRLHCAGASNSEIARRLPIGRTSVRRILADPVSGAQGMARAQNRWWEKPMSPQAGPNINPTIWTAIEQKRLLRFRHKNRERVVEPYDYGMGRAAGVESWVDSAGPSSGRCR
jgi:hypothetical protein